MSKTENNSKSSSSTLTKDEVQSHLLTLPSKSSKIRYLHTNGYKVSQICKLIKYDDGRDLRPQHVYNVLKTPLMGSK